MIQAPLSNTNKSLLVAVLACLAMGLFARSPQFSGGNSWVSLVFILATFGLSAWGLALGVKGYREQRKPMSLLAPFINGFVALSFAGFLFLMWRALQHLN